MYALVSRPRQPARPRFTVLKLAFGEFKLWQCTIQLAKALGFGGEYPIDAWVRARADRFTVLACIKFARAVKVQNDTENAPVSLMLSRISMLPDTLVNQPLIPFIRGAEYSRVADI